MRIINEITRDTLGAIWRLCEQMAYTAEQGHAETLKAQFDALKRLMEKLETVQKMVS